MLENGNDTDTRPMFGPHLVPDPESVDMLYRQLARRQYPLRPSLDEVVSYLQDYGAVVAIEGDSLFVRWPIGRRFFD